MKQWGYYKYYTKNGLIQLFKGIYRAAIKGFLMCTLPTLFYDEK